MSVNLGVHLSPYITGMHVLVGFSPLEHNTFEVCAAPSCMIRGVISNFRVHVTSRGKWSIMM